jgi:hypothetical protein
MTLSKPIVDTIIDTMLDVWETAERWTKGTIAKSENGDDVSAESPYATSWCAIGAAHKAMYHLGLTAWSDEFESFMNYCVQKKMNHAASYKRYSNIAAFNDDEGTSFEDVKLFIKCMKDEEFPLQPTCPCPNCNQ